MITTSSYQTRFGTYTKNSSTANLALGLELVNQSLRYLTGQFFFNERSYTTLTVAGQQFYQLPPQVKRLLDVTVNIGGVLWTTKPAPNREYWDMLNVITFDQDFPSFHYVYNGNQCAIWPTPATSGNIITMNYATRTRDLSQADYTTGTVSTPYTTTFTTSIAKGATSGTLSGTWPLVSGTYQIVFSDSSISQATFTNGSTAVTWTTPTDAAVTATVTVNSSLGGSLVIGSGTTFVSDMVNRWLQITAPTGDNQWYQIGEYYSATQLALLNPYSGTSVSGASFTIGEAPILYEDYQDLALYRALKIYFSSIVPDQTRYQTYSQLYDEGFAMLQKEYGQKTTTPVLTDSEAPVYNPNLFVRSVNQP